MDAKTVRDERGRCGRRNRVVLISRRWDQPPGQEPGGTVAKKPGTPGRARISRTTIAQGMPECFGVPVVTNSRVFALYARLRVRETPGIPCALSYVRATRLMHHSGISCRGNVEVCRQAID